MYSNKLERKLRRDLTVLCYQLCKSRSKCWPFDNQLGYMIIDGMTNAVIAGSRYDLSLDDVREFVAE